MKILLTGHTSNIGSVLYNHLSKHHDVTGISRQTNFDLRNKEIFNLSGKSYTQNMWAKYIETQTLFRSPTDVVELVKGMISSLILLMQEKGALSPFKKQLTLFLAPFCQLLWPIPIHHCVCGFVIVLSVDMLNHLRTSKFIWPYVVA